MTHHVSRREFLNAGAVCGLNYATLAGLAGNPFRLVESASSAVAAALQSSEAPHQITVLPDWDAPGDPFRHNWEGIVNVDQFRWMVRRDMQNQLRMAHTELGARQVRAVGMFDDEMRLLGSDPAKSMVPGVHEPRLNWQIIDYVFNSLEEIGIDPIYTTTFMPTALASGPQTVFSTRSNVTPPRSYSQWGEIVEKSVRHAKEMYGRDVMRRWYFEVWNEPNLEGFFAGDQNEYFKLWATTYDAIKRVDPELRVGGPSTARGEWIGDFLEFGRKSGCSPDFVITHCYNNDSASKPLSPFDGPQEDKLNRSPHFLAGVVRGARKTLEELSFKGELHFNEWGRSWFPYDPARETSFEAAFIARNMAEVSQDANRFAYWCLSDIYDQVGYGAETFHGNYGMLNLQSLRKPSWFAFQLLQKLGDTRIPHKSEGTDRLNDALVTSSKDGYRILFYGSAADPKIAAGDSRISIALPPRVVGEDLTLWVVAPGINDIVRQWKAMGSSAYLSSKQLAELRGGNTLEPVPAGKIAIEKSDTHLIARFSIPSPFAALLEIQKA